MAYKGNTEAQRKAIRKYLAESVDNITVRVPKGKKSTLLHIAEKHGLSLNQCINEFINFCLDHESDIFL